MLPCSLCTYLNESHRRTCEMCDNLLSTLPSISNLSSAAAPGESVPMSGKAPVISLAGEEDEDEEEDRYFTFLNQNIHLITDESQSNKSQGWTCPYQHSSGGMNSKVFKSLNMFKVHLFREHRNEIDALMKKPEIIPTPSSSSAILSDAEYALSLALQDYDESVKQSSSSSSSSSSSTSSSQVVHNPSTSLSTSQSIYSHSRARPILKKPRIVTPIGLFGTPSSKSTTTKCNKKSRANKEENLNEGDDDKFTDEKLLKDKESRLQRLLEKTDRIANTLSRSIFSSSAYSSSSSSSYSSSSTSISVLPSSVVQAPLCLKGCLRDYQLGGLQWLFGLHTSGVNGILADEMGKEPSYFFYQPVHSINLRLAFSSLFFTSDSLIMFMSQILLIAFIFIA